MSKSAAKIAHGLIAGGGQMLPAGRVDLCNALLREDRQRVRMERAILAWWKTLDSPYPKAAFPLASIAERLARPARKP